MSSDNFMGNDRRVMPFYLICDVSWSMRNEMEALHDGVTQLWEAIVSAPILDDGTRVCVMTFSDDAKVVAPLARMSDYEDGVPEFAHEHLTDYGNAFRALAAEMADDYAGLRRDGYDVYRPCVYFLTDGEPTDPGWYVTFTETLTKEAMARRGLPTFPIFVPFGFREAKVHTLSRLAYPERVSKYYHASNATIGQALDGLLGIVKNSVLLSSQSMKLGAPQHVLPEPGRGSGIDCHVAGYDPAI